MLASLTFIGCGKQEIIQTVDMVVEDSVIQTEKENAVEKLPAGRYRYTMDKLDELYLAGSKPVEMGKHDTVLFEKKNDMILYKIPGEIPVEFIKTIMLEVEGDEVSLNLCNDDADFTRQNENEPSIKITKNQITGKVEDIKLLAVVNENDGQASSVIKSISFVIEEPKSENSNEKLQGDLTVDCFKSMSNNNPIVTQRYSADPCAMVYDDTVYIYSTNDVYEYKGDILGDNTYSKLLL